MRRGYSRRSLLAATGAAAVGFSLAGAAEAKAKPLQFYNWDTYIGETTLADFEMASGVPVDMHLFATNQELQANIRAGKRYDVIVPCSDYLAGYIHDGLLTELDHARLPNLANIDTGFRDPPYDPGCRFSVPYTWLVQGIGYRKSAMPNGVVPDSWKWVFDSQLFNGRIAWINEPVDMMSMAALYLGHDIDDRSDATLAECEALLSRQVARVRFHEDDGQNLLVAGDVDLVIEYNGDIAFRGEDDLDIGFVIPREGSRILADIWAIPRTAPQPEAAHDFLNFMLSADADRDITRAILYPTPNAAARAMMPSSYRDNPILFPPAEAMAKCRFPTLPDEERAQAVGLAFDRIRGT